LRPMRKILFGIILLMAFPILNGQVKKGYEINVNIIGLKDSTLFLAYHFGDKQYIKDTIKLDNTGHGRFRGNETLPEGIYLVVLPGRKYFEILASTD
jgi:hypothetical protein